MADICYKKNYLKQVVAQIQFAQPLVGLNNDSLTAIVSEIRKRFPFGEQSTAIQQGIEISGEGITSSKTEFPEWIFHGENRKKTIKINQMILEIGLTEYISDSEFFSDLIPIIQILQSKQTVPIARTGVRFINIFDDLKVGASDFSLYFSEKITSHITNKSDIEKCIRSILLDEYVFNEIKVRVQTGLFNPDYPAVIKRNHFVIDIDAYIDFPHQLTSPADDFKKIHSIIQSQFENSIKDKLRLEVLGVNQ